MKKQMKQWIAAALSVLMILPCTVLALADNGTNQASPVVEAEVLQEEQEREWEPLSKPDTEKQYIQSGWLLKSTKDFDDTGEMISQADYKPEGWMPAVVPGTLLSSYVKNGLYPDPYYDINNKRSEGLIPDASEEGTDFTYAHWYRTTFSLDQSYDGKTVWLNLDGINWKADVYLNGQEVGHMDGMFKRGKLDVTDVAQIGENAVAVKVYPLDSPGVPYGSGCGGDRTIGQNAATMYATIGWDFTIVDGIRDRNVGIYRDVYVTKTETVRVEDPYMITNGVPGETADLSFKVNLRNPEAREVSGTLRLDIQGGITVEAPVTLEANEVKEIMLTSDRYPALVIENPRLWWPNGKGSQELYDLDVSFVEQDGTVSDTNHSRFGIRSIEVDTQTYNGQFSLIVNGERMFIQGGNWVQDAMVKSTKRDYDVKLRQIQQGGFNLLRLWSASGEECDYFFEKCDELGILTWVESGAAAQVEGPSDIPMQLDNWADTILRVRSHPSVAVYCGCNEGQPCEGTGDMVDQYDGYRWYQNSSQDNGQRGAPYRYLGVDTLYDYTAHDLYGSGPLGPLAGFCNETGNPALPPAEVLKDFIPEEKLWPTQNNPEFIESINYHDGGGFHLMTEFINQGASQYGPFDTADMGGRTGIDNYAFKGQLLGAMEYRADTEVWKRNKWNVEDEKYNTGYALWTINNANPMASSRIANYSGEANAALYYASHGNKPVHAQYDYYYNDVSLVNDTNQALENLTVRAQVRNLDWSLVWSREKSGVNVDADTTLRGVLSVPDRQSIGYDNVHFIYVELFDAEGNQVDDMIYWRARNGGKYGADGDFSALNSMPGAQLEVSSTVEIKGEKQEATVTLYNPTDQVAFFTRLKIYNQQSRELMEYTYYSDNYFSILPGETKTIALDFYTDELAGESPLLLVEGWNLGHLEIPMNGSGTTSQALDPNNLAYEKTAEASGSAQDHEAGLATDGDETTTWRPDEQGETAWIQVDLGEAMDVNRVQLLWEVKPSQGYQVLVSSEPGGAFTQVATSDQAGQDGALNFAATKARLVRIAFDMDPSQSIPSLQELRVYRKTVDSIQITVEGGEAVVTQENGTLQFYADVYPDYLVDPSVTWSVVNLDGEESTGAVIDENGLLTAQKNGTVRVVAQADDGSGISDWMEVEISGQTADLEVAYDDNASFIQYSDGWNYEENKAYVYKGTVHSKDQAGVWFQFQFDGVRARIYGSSNTWCGLADIYLDGQKVETVDLYNKENRPQVCYYDTGNLEKGIHTVKVVSLGQSHPGGNGAWVECDRVDISGTPIVPVQSIVVSGYGGEDSIQERGGTLQMVASVYPQEADQDVIWSVTNLDGSQTDLASISQEGLLQSLGYGRVLVTAASRIDPTVAGTKIITLTGEIDHPVESILVEGGDSIRVPGGTLQMEAIIQPETADLKVVQWSVTDLEGGKTTCASIDEQGLLTAQQNGKVKVVAEAIDGSGVRGEAVVSIMGQPVYQSTVWEDDHVGILYSGDWNVDYKPGYSDGRNHTTQAAGSYYEFIFEGVGARIYGTRNAWVGKADIYVDDMESPATVFDGYQASETYQALYYDTGMLPEGTHTVRVVVREDKNPDAHEKWIECDKIEIVTRKNTVQQITVTGENGQDTISQKGGSLQMTAAVWPEDADDTAVTWSVQNQDGTPTDKAVISPDGLLTAQKDGTVLVSATAQDGSEMVGDCLITITGQDETAEVTVASDKSAYEVNEKITLTITTPREINRLSLRNERGLGLGLQKVHSRIEKEAKVWTIELSLGTAGEARTISVWTYCDEIWQETGASVTFSVEPENPSVKPVIWSADFDRQEVAANQWFAVEVKTSVGVSKIFAQNELGRFMGLQDVAYTDEGDVRTWTMKMSVGTPGMRIFSFSADDGRGNRIPVTVENSIRILP